jgi:hypothetical protein
VLPEKIDVNVLVDLGKLSGSAWASATTPAAPLDGRLRSFSFDFSDDFTLDGGVRFNYEEKKMNYILFQNWAASRSHCNWANTTTITRRPARSA